MQICTSAASQTSGHSGWFVFALQTIRLYTSLRIAEEDELAGMQVLSHPARRLSRCPPILSFKVERWTVQS
jgi:hypothetical protein